MAARFYRARETVSITSALSTTLTIYTCQILHTEPGVHQCYSLKLQLLTAWTKEWLLATVDSLPQAVNFETHCISGHRTHNLPIVSPMRYQLCYRDHLGLVMTMTMRISGIGTLLCMNFT